MDQYRAVDIEDKPEPEDMMPGITYIVTNPGAPGPWLVAFLCPCNCGAASYNIVRDAVPGHTGQSCILTRHQGTITLSPSINRNRNGACGAHFWLTEGRIRWC